MEEECIPMPQQRDFSVFIAVSQQPGSRMNLVDNGTGGTSPGIILILFEVDFLQRCHNNYVSNGQYYSIPVSFELINLAFKLPGQRTIMIQK